MTERLANPKVSRLAISVVIPDLRRCQYAHMGLPKVYGKLRHAAQLRQNPEPQAGVGNAGLRPATPFSPFLAEPGTQAGMPRSKLLPEDCQL